jgi:CRISPR-associated protein Cas2
MRNRYIVCYDIRDPKRLRKVFDKMHGFGNPLQYSVFQCDLSLQKKFRMLDELSALIHHDEDRVMIVDLGPADGRGRDCFLFLGRGSVPPAGPAPVIV